MAKRSFDIGKLVKASHKQMCYEQQGDCVCLSDKRGRIAIQTNDITVLGELVKRGVELTERLGLKQTIDQIMNKDRAENLYSYTATGIQFPYYDHSDGKGKVLTMFRDCQQDYYAVKLADKVYTEIFDPVLITGGKSLTDPIIMVCSDCFGIVLPMRVNRQYTVDQRENVKHLLDYLNAIR